MFPCLEQLKLPLNALYFRIRKKTRNVLSSKGQLEYIQYYPSNPYVLPLIFPTWFHMVPQTTTTWPLLSSLPYDCVLSFHSSSSTSTTTKSNTLVDFRDHLTKNEHTVVRLEQPTLIEVKMRFRWAEPQLTRSEPIRTGLSKLIRGYVGRFGP